MMNFYRSLVVFLGGAFGWFCDRYMTTFPLIAVCFGFVLWDVWSAYELSCRAHKKYPKNVKHEKAKFESDKVGKVIITFIKCALVILLMHSCRKYVCSGLIDIPLDYISAGVICGWQFLSVLENNMSCPLEEKDSKLWKILHGILIDKTERHLDISLDALKVKEDNPQNN